MSTINPLLQSQEPNYYDTLLPSKGLTYINNLNDIFEEGALINGSVQIRPLTTKDELIWTDKKLVEDFNIRYND